MKKLEEIVRKIKSGLEGTEFSVHVHGELWDLTWMDGFRIKVSTMLNLKSGNRVLDVGCGDGWFTLQNALAYPRVEFVGIDLFEAEEAEEIAKLLKLENCKFYKIDALKMNFKEEFDHIALFMALGNICETFKELERLFNNCWRALRSGGRLLVVEPFEEDFPIDFPIEVRDTVKRLYELYRNLKKPRGEDKEVVLSRDKVITALEKAGFKVLELNTARFNWYMTKSEVKEYFDLKELPLDIPDKIWVHDKPRRVTIILALKC